MRGRHKLTVFTTKSACLTPLLINENLLIYPSIGYSSTLSTRQLVYSSTCLLVN